MAMVLSGRVLVVGLLAAGVAAATGAVLYRTHARKRHAIELEDAALRPRALLGLLRANGLWGAAREYVLDGRPASPGKPYLRARAPDGGALYVVRAVRAGGLAPPEAATIIFSASGKLLHFLEAAQAYPIEGPDGAPAVALIVPPPAGTSGFASVLLLGEGAGDGGLRPALRIRGPFALETAEGRVEPRWGEQEALERGSTGAAIAAIPLFRYDRAAACFRGPPGSPGDPWEVDAAASPRYRP